MASKYSGLPDIDTSNPDVYETPDVPSSFSFGHDSDSDSDHGLSTSGSSSNLLSAAAATIDKKAPTSSDDAIDKGRLKPADARDLFIKRNTASSSSSNGARSSRSLLPETSTYSVKNATRRHHLSETAKRQLRHQHRLDDDGNPLLDEPETPTEKLRRLRYETEELEAELEAQAAEKAKSKQRYNASTAGNEDIEESEESEYEQINDLPKRDDADKTKPPPGRRRRKKSQLDENGELSPAVLIKQLKRLRGGLSAMSISESEALDADGEGDGSSEAKTKELLHKLGQIRTHAINGEEQTTSHQRASTSRTVESTNLSQLDVRLDTLEKVVGTNEADVDEARPLPPPLLTTLARLEHQLQLLTQPRHLDTISRRVKTLVTDLERVHEARRKIGDTRPLNIALSSGITISTGQPGLLPPSTPGSTTLALPGTTASEPQLPPDALQKIDALFNILPRIDPLLPLAPHLLTRLTSLATLHESSTTFAEDLKDGQKSIEGLKESEGFLKHLLDGLQESLAANQEVMKNNLEGLQSRIDTVLARVNTLE